MPSTQQILVDIENILQASGCRPAPSYIADDLPVESIAPTGAYSIGPGPSSTRLFDEYLEGTRTFRISILFRSPPHPSAWKTPAMLDKEDALAHALLTLHYTETIAADYAPDEGRRFTVLSLDLTTRYERELV
jgi:hypothetical protein